VSKESRNSVDTPKESAKTKEPVKKAWRTNNPNSPKRKSPVRESNHRLMEDDVGFGILQSEPKRAKKNSTSQSSSSRQGSGSQGSSPKPAQPTYSTNAKPGSEKKKYGTGDTVPWNCLKGLRLSWQTRNTDASTIIWSQPDEKRQEASDAFFKCRTMVENYWRQQTQTNLASSRPAPPLYQTGSGNKRKARLPDFPPQPTKPKFQKAIPILNSSPNPAVGKKNLSSLEIAKRLFDLETKKAQERLNQAAEVQRLKEEVAKKLQVKEVKAQAIKDRRKARNAKAKKKAEDKEVKEAQTFVREVFDQDEKHIKGRTFTTQDTDTQLKMFKCLTLLNISHRITKFDDGELNLEITYSLSAKGNGGMNTFSTPQKRKVIARLHRELESSESEVSEDEEGYSPQLRKGGEPLI
jgi:hypothetical protein